MHDQRVQSVDHRIVSIHQPHVRPIERGKTNDYVEFGAKITVIIINDLVFLEDLSWEAFNEGTRLIKLIGAAPPCLLQTFFSTFLVSFMPA